MNQYSTSAAIKPPTTERGKRTRQQLLEAAEEVFGKKGFERAGIADITQAAGVALGTFYVYFPDKTAIFIELVDELGARLRRTLAAAVEGAEGRLEIERRGLAAFFTFAAKHRELYRIVRQCEFVDEPTFRRYYARLADGYARGLQKAIDAGEIEKRDPELLAYALMGIADFLGMRFVLWNNKTALDQKVDEAMAFITHGLSRKKK